MFVFARRSLVPDGWIATPRSTERAALLLEGDWPDDDLASSVGEHRLSLDTKIDATRFATLDVEAERLTIEIIRTFSASVGEEDLRPNFADINALRLRYETVRWLRIIAFWCNCRDEFLGDDETAADVDLYVAPGRDNEYAVLWQAMSHALGFTLRIHFVLRDGAKPARFSLPRNAWWRRALAAVFANRGSDSDHRRPVASAHRPRVLFVGNPRILDPVCDALLDRGANVAWLYDRFAVGAWFARRSDGVAWLTCDGAEPAVDHPFAKALRSGVTYDGIELSEVVDAWSRRWRRHLGDLQSRQWHRIGRHLASLRPQRIVLDEDATPLARITIAHAARLGIPTTVVQHGVCCVRFGFAPLAADMFCAWDDATRRQLEAWNVPSERIVVTGPPREPSVITARRDDSTATRIVLLATLPPRDERPDAVELHLTTSTHAAMLHAACAAVDELRSATSQDVELVIKMHPRAPHDPQLANTLRKFPSLRHRIVVDGPLGDVLGSADCVLSCVSSAGIEAAAAGLPVVQLLPQGSGSILPAEWYGLLGSARTLEELRPLLQTALARGRVAVSEHVRASSVGAAARIAEVVLAPCESRRHDESDALVGPYFTRRLAASNAEATDG